MSGKIEHFVKPMYVNNDFNIEENIENKGVYLNAEGVKKRFLKQNLPIVN